MYSTAYRRQRRRRKARMLDDRDISEIASSDTTGESLVTMPKAADAVPTPESKEDVFDLKLRVFMAETNKLSQDAPSSECSPSEYARLLASMDEKNELLIKAEEVTSYLRSENQKLQNLCLEQERSYKEHVKQLEREIEGIRNSKFANESSRYVINNSVCGTLTPPSSDDESQRRISELEYKMNELNKELEMARGVNEQLKQTIHNLQDRLSNSCSDIKKLNEELSCTRLQRDQEIENSIRFHETLDELKSQKQQLEYKLKVMEESKSKALPPTSDDQKLNDSKKIDVDVTTKVDKAAAAIIRQLLRENKHLRKSSDGACQNCTMCQKLRRSKNVSINDSDDSAEVPSEEIESETELRNIFEKSVKVLNFEAQLAEKNKMIEQLKEELKKRTFNLQELVNKELWSKNREIEKLMKICDKRKHEIDQLRKQLCMETPISVLREVQPSMIKNEKENILSTSDDVKLLKEQLRHCLDEKKTLLEKIKELECRLTTDEDSLVRNLQMECAKRKDEADEADRARRDAFVACTLLTGRLEELATFLESLLRHDYSAQKKRMILEAIDRSREITRSFAASFEVDNASTTGTRFASSVDLSAPVLPDCSEINLSFSCDDDSEQKPVFERIRPSTESADDEVPKGTLHFVNGLGACDQLIFSTEGVHRIDDETAHMCPELMEECGNAEIRQDKSTATSALVSMEEEPKKTMYDSESETWSEPDRNVSAARIGLQDPASKIHAKRLRPEQRPDTDSEVSSRSGRKCLDANDIRQMQKRIQHLENVNESLKRELMCRKFGSPVNESRKTNVEKFKEQTKLHQVMARIGQEPIADVDKYREYTEKVRKHLSDLSKYLHRTNHLEEYVDLKLKEVAEHFEMSELCCTKLQKHAEELRSRCDTLTDFLEETQMKFEKVMIDLHTTKLAYNNVILEHEQNIYKYKEAELYCEQYKEKYKSAENSRRRLEYDLKDSRSRQRSLERELQKNEHDTKYRVSELVGERDILKDQLNKTTRRVAELESTMTSNDETLHELNKCKADLELLTKENEKLLNDLDVLTEYRDKIDEYERQLNQYKNNCGKLELELFEKENLERLYREQCEKYEEELKRKEAVNETLQKANAQLMGTKQKMRELEDKVSELSNVIKGKENTILEKNCLVLELQTKNETDRILLNEQKQSTERELKEKIQRVKELEDRLRETDESAKKFESELNTLKGTLKRSEEDKQRYKHKMEKQFNDFEILKKQHEQKMRHLLEQVICYRHEEESNLETHRKIIEQIEEAQNNKDQWKQNVEQWKSRYDALKKEKDEVQKRLNNRETFEGTESRSNSLKRASIVIDNEYKLMRLNMERDWYAREAELRYQLDIATLTTSHVILEWTRLANEKLRLQRELHRRDKPDYVDRLEHVKSELEGRVKELETANGDLEMRLQRLQISKSPGSTSPESRSLPTSPRRTSPLFISSLSLREAVLNDEIIRVSHECTTPTRRHSDDKCATSPDLGIYSDNGKSSSFDFDGMNSESKIHHEIEKLEDENHTLKRQLNQTKKELEETLGKLTSLNKNKKKMEKAIFKQIHETKYILKKARVNLEDGQESGDN